MGHINTLSHACCNVIVVHYAIGPGSQFYVFLEKKGTHVAETSEVILHGPSNFRLKSAIFLIESLTFY